MFAEKFKGVYFTSRWTFLSFFLSHHVRQTCEECLTCTKRQILEFIFYFFVTIRLSTVAFDVDWVSDKFYFICVKIRSEIEINVALR